jgi:hypothetical protein
MVASVLVFILAPLGTLIVYVTPSLAATELITPVAVDATKPLSADFLNTGALIVSTFTVHVATGPTALVAIVGTTGLPFAS